MLVLVSGSTGPIDRALVPHLERDGHEVTRLVRPGTAETVDGIRWAPASGEIDRDRLEGFDAVVHLAGETVDQRWTGRTRRRIRDGRVEGTRLPAGAVADLVDPPEVPVSASAVGYYGDRGDARLEEDAGPGDLFISAVSAEREAASRVAAENGVRVVNTRTGVVLALATGGGALPRMLPPFGFGLGGHLGSGDRCMSWVTRDDVVRIVEHLVGTGGVEGPVNVSAPEPVTDRAFTDALGAVLGRPTVLRVPGIGVRLLFGRMGEELLLASDRMRTTKPEASGYAWRHPELEPALEHVLNDG